MVRNRGEGCYFFTRGDSVAQMLTQCKSFGTEHGLIHVQSLVPSSDSWFLQHIQFDGSQYSWVASLKTEWVTSCLCIPPDHSGSTPPFLLSPPPISKSKSSLKQSLSAALFVTQVASVTLVWHTSVPMMELVQTRTPGVSTVTEDFLSTKFGELQNWKKSLGTIQCNPLVTPGKIETW